MRPASDRVKLAEGWRISLEDDAILTTPLLPGLDLPLKRVFELP